MSAVELAGIVEGWATVVGLVVIVLGAAFAGLQLRRESQASHLQAVVALYADIFPIEAVRAAQIVVSLPDGFDYDQASADERDAIRQIVFRYNRLGYLLRAGLVRDEDLFPFIAFGTAAILAWEKLKHVVRAGVAGRTGGTGGIGISSVDKPDPESLPGGLHFEFLVSRAQQYLLEHGEAEFGELPIFDADLPAIGAMGEAAQRARVAAG